MFTLLFAVIVIGWVAAAVLGTQAYFRGEQRKPIHARNWNSEPFEQLAMSFTGEETDYGDRVPGFDVTDSYAASR
ncbi:MAG: hypothetical protein HC824_16695 [Synechococcales cyanobacterium RM1_1_8]|nr:hypothetical protein [Synechococcales cyanobacterium RM1_1_8]